MSRSEAVVIESIEVRDHLRFLFYLDILKKLLLLQCKHSKYMYARCLNFPCFIKYLAAYMHAFCMFYLYVSLGYIHSFSNSNFVNPPIFGQSSVHLFAKILGILWLPSTFSNGFVQKTKTFVMLRFLPQSCVTLCFPRLSTTVLSVAFAKIGRKMRWLYSSF